MRSARNIGWVALIFTGLFGCTSEFAAPEPRSSRFTAKDSRYSGDDSEADECYSLTDVNTGKVFSGLQASDDGSVYSGDMIVGRVDRKSFALGLGIVHNFFGMGKPWTNGTVPYNVEGTDNNFRNLVGTYFADLNTILNPTINFVQRTDQQNYIAVLKVPGNLSTSPVGMVGGRQELRLSDGWNKAVMFHELGHALGLLHEQMRWDRDDYITIQDGNIPANLTLQYAKMFGNTTGTFDLNSLMLYDSCGGYSPFGCSSPHFTLKNGGQHRAKQVLSTGDIAAIKDIYDIPETATTIDHMAPQYKLAGVSKFVFAIKAMPSDNVLTGVRYNPANGYWNVYGRTDIDAFFFGGNGHVPVPGNYYGDDADEQGVFYPGKRKWYVGEEVHEWPETKEEGLLIPVPFDYDGDGFLNFAVFNRADGKWHIRGESVVTWADDPAKVIPVPGNYGAERGKIAWFNPETGYFGFQANGEKLRIADPENQPVPVVADYDGDDKDDLAVYYYDTGVWIFLSSVTGKLMSYDTTQPQRLPFAADFNLDGTVETRLFQANNEFADVPVLASAAEVQLPTQDESEEGGEDSGIDESDATSDDMSSSESNESSDGSSRAGDYRIDRSECN